jgi:hypothetical protein
MGSLIGHYTLCRKLLCQAAKAGNKVTYEDLTVGLGFQSPRQQWSTVLGPIAADEVRKTGHDLTLVVVYKSGPAKGLSRAAVRLRNRRFLIRKTHSRSPPTTGTWRLFLRPTQTRSANCCMCQVSIIRKRGQYLGTVEVPNEKAAEPLLHHQPPALLLAEIKFSHCSSLPSLRRRHPKQSNFGA